MANNLITLGQGNVYIYPQEFIITQPPQRRSQTLPFVYVVLTFKLARTVHESLKVNIYGEKCLGTKP